MAQFVGPHIRSTKGIHHTYTSESIDYGVWTFLEGTGSFTATIPVTCDILVVAGGGGGGDLRAAHDPAAGSAVRRRDIDDPRGHAPADARAQRQPRAAGRGLRAGVA